ncbi:ubiquitin-activating E1 FCCH domain-containing protein [Sphingobium yanoikuyae]|uniref:ubiquitin-activating E1 FCCH domain-containing protein n=1 Tax=Sphingobium yanoikuyae TaxID=13690 RepID=UPI00289C1D49|nr:ubiquitin-activating E1 FCCH domain-containing protein [Sphingobium yanoikuyae]
MAADAQLAALMARNANLFTAYEDFSNSQTALNAGTRDDPGSFNATGGKTGNLGYYPVKNANGTTLLLPCLDRIAADLGASVDAATAGLPTLKTQVADLRSRESLALLKSYGCPLDGVGDDAPGLQLAYNALPRGLCLNLGAATLLTVATPLVITGKPFRLLGSGLSYSPGQGTAIRVTCRNAFQITQSYGFEVSDAYIYGQGEAQTGGTLFQFLPGATNSGMVSFARLRIVNFWAVWNLRKVFNFYADNVTTSGIGTTDPNANAGSGVLIQNGSSDDDQANAIVAKGCTFGAKAGTDMLVFDGRCGSAKLLACSWGFGRHGIVSTNSTVGPSRAIASITQSPDTFGWRVTTATNHGVASGAKVLISGVIATTEAGQSINAEWTATRIDDTTLDLDETEYATDTYSGGNLRKSEGGIPGFIYVEGGGGMENITGDGVRLEYGSNFQAVGLYISTDGDGICVNQSETYGGEVVLDGMIIRAAGREGLRIGSGYMTVSGGHIVNNGRIYVDVAKKDVLGAIDNGSGAIRITSNAHGMNTGDLVLMQSVGGVPNANGQRTITVIDANTFDLQGTTFAGAYISGGKIFRLRIVVNNAVNNGSGLIRLTIPNHPFKSNDWIRVAGVGGVANANGDFRVAVIDANTVDIVKKIDGTVPAFSGPFTTAGGARFASPQIAIGPSASHVVINGMRLGKAKAGINRSTAAAIVEGTYCKFVGTDRTIGATGTLYDASGGSTNFLDPAPLTQTSGSITPTLETSGVALAGATYALQSGSWIRIGDMVFYEIQMTVTPTMGSASGNLRLMLNGAPLARSSGAAQTTVPGTAPAQLTWPNTSTQLLAEMQGNTNYLHLKGSKTGASTATTAITALTDGVAATIRIAGMYRAA